MIKKRKILKCYQKIRRIEILIEKMPNNKK